MHRFGLPVRHARHIHKQKEPSRAIHLLDFRDATRCRPGRFGCRTRVGLQPCGHLRQRAVERPLCARVCCAGLRNRAGLLRNHTFVLRRRLGRLLSGKSPKPGVLGPRVQREIAWRSEHDRRVWRTKQACCVRARPIDGRVGGSCPVGSVGSGGPGRVAPTRTLGRADHSNRTPAAGDRAGIGADARTGHSGHDVAMGLILAAVTLALTLALSWQIGGTKRRILSSCPARVADLTSMNMSGGRDKRCSVSG